jgi:hypothetical protein
MPKNLSTLPPAIISNIGSMLDSADKKALACTSKEINEYLGKPTATNDDLITILLREIQILQDNRKTFNAGDTHSHTALGIAGTTLMAIADVDRDSKSWLPLSIAGISLMLAGLFTLPIKDYISDFKARSDINHRYEAITRLRKRGTSLYRNEQSLFHHTARNDYHIGHILDEPDIG